MSFDKLTRFSSELKTTLNLPYKSDFTESSRLNLPEWVVDHVLGTGSYPEDWESQLRMAKYGADSFTVEINASRPGYTVVFYRDYDYLY